MNLTFDNLSFWERKWLLEDLDFVIVGAGIVGLSAAFHLKRKHPQAKVVIIDKGILPLSASSKNAGFACFGSPSEIIDDLACTSREEVFKTVEMRWNGLRSLKEWLGKDDLELETLGSWDLIENASITDKIRDLLPMLNSELQNITLEPNTFSEDTTAIKRFGFDKLSSAFYNRLEGQLNTSKLIQKALWKVHDAGVIVCRGVSLISYSSENTAVHIHTNFGTLQAQNLVLCTNGFTSEIDEKWDVKPARAQVLITKEIANLKIKGTFHMDRGYYYFRNVGNRLLIGGGRNTDFKKEETTEMETTTDIQASILTKLNQVILPTTPFEVDYSWAGIMGVGQNKQPIIERLDSRVCVGIRMGGMGVAIGTFVGQKLAELNS